MEDRIMNSREFSLGEYLFGDLLINSPNFARSQDRRTIGRTLVAIDDIITLRFLSVFLYRVSHVVGRRSSLLALIVKQVNQLLTGADIAWPAKIGPGLSLRHPVGVAIGPDVYCEGNLIIQQGVTIGGDGAVITEGAIPSPTIGSGVMLGAGCRVLGDISLGDNVVVGANAVVIRDVEADSFVAGVPARLIRKIDLNRE